MRRRDFIAGVAGSTAAWPFAARAAQQPDPMRRIGVLVGDAAIQSTGWLDAFREGMARLGWSEGSNIHIDYRFVTSELDSIPVLVKELVALQPEVIVSQGTALTAAAQRAAPTIPIVFLTVSDPIGSGYVASLGRPAGNLTGLMMYEEGITGKWLAMLKEVAPSVTRVALVASASTAYDYYVRAAIATAPSNGFEIVPLKVGKPAEIERAIETFARTPNGGLLVPPDNTTLSSRDLIVALAARHRLPAVYALRIFVVAGGLMSYGTINADMYRNAAFYVDRILKGAKPADLPVQAPTKYETVINQKTARELGLTIPSGLLVAADEVIE